MIFRSASSMTFVLEDVEAVSLGRVGIVTLREKLTTAAADHFSRAVLAATNVFELTDDGWKLILHQAGPTETDQSFSRDDADEDEDDFLR